ncbi:MAG: plasmid pRiA4b ORF-3 family protein [Rhodothermia bacterium]
MAEQPRNTGTVRSIRLTETQRKSVAELVPDLAGRLKLDERNQRSIRLSLEDIRAIQQKARDAIPHAETGTKRNSLRHVINIVTEAIENLRGIGAIPASKRLYQFKITLTDMEPPIWRRIQVKDCTLDKLHEHIQTAMGWTNSHLHQFKIGGLLYGDPQLLSEGFQDDPEVVNSLETRISEIVPENGSRFALTYEYDFGDGWKHEILFEGCLRADRSTQYSLCVEGERACPPEDVGGVRGYQEYLETLSNPDHEEWDETSEWRGPCRPEEFDAGVATKRMRRGLPNWRSQDG